MLRSGSKSQESRLGHGSLPGKDTHCFFPVAWVVFRRPVTTLMNRPSCHLRNIPLPNKFWIHGEKLSSLSFGNASLSLWKEPYETTHPSPCVVTVSHETRSALVPSSVWPVKRTPGLALQSTSGLLSNSRRAPEASLGLKQEIREECGSD